MLCPPCYVHLVGGIGVVELVVIGCMECFQNSGQRTVLVQRLISDGGKSRLLCVSEER